MALDISVATASAQTAVGVAGALIIGVMVAIKAIDWIKCVIIERQASREYEDRYGS